MLIYEQIKPRLKELMLKTCNKYQYAYWIDHADSFIYYYIAGIKDELELLDYGRRTGILMIYDKYCKCIEQLRKELDYNKAEMTMVMASGSDEFQYLAEH